MKSDDLLKRDFRSGIALENVLQISRRFQYPIGKLYVSATFDCFDLSALGMVMESFSP